MNIRRTVITGAAALALVAGGTLAGAVAFASSGTVYKGCVTGSSRTMEHVYTKSNPPRCPSGSFSATWNAVGQQGPSGVVSATNSSGQATESWTFIRTASETFANTKTAAEVTGTVDLASTDGNGISEFLGICYQPAGGTITDVSEVAPEFTAPAHSFFAQTVSGIVGNLTGGTYTIGLCQSQLTSNIADGNSAVSIVMAQTASGVTSQSRSKAASAQRPGTR
jgi:hypothetical protein